MAKRQNSPFVLITPEDISNLSPAERNALLAAQTGCDTTVLIKFGQTVNDALTSSDCGTDDGSFGDFYAFEGAAGQQVTVALGSSAFDTYLFLASEDGSFLVSDDDGGGKIDIAIYRPNEGNWYLLRSRDGSTVARFGVGGR